MLKRTIFYIVMFLFLCGTTAGVYFYNAPNTIKVVSNQIQFNIVPRFTYNTIDNYIIEKNQTINVIFYQNEDSQSLYLFDTILTDILNQHDLDAFSNLVYCDLTDVEDLDSNETKNRWGFYAMPALINFSIKDGLIVVNSSLDCSDIDSINQQRVEVWLSNNNAIPN